MCAGGLKCDLSIKDVVVVVSRGKYGREVEEVRSV